MKLFVFIFFFIQLFSLRVFGETKVLLIDGGPSKYSNYYSYYNAVRRAYEVSLSQNKKAAIVAKNGSWELSQRNSEKLSSFSLTETGRKSTNPNSEAKPSYPPITGKAEDVRDIIAGIRSLDLKPGDNLLIYNVGHGGSPKNKNDASSSTIKLWGKELPINELKKIVEELPKGVQIKYATTTCYGGGIHALARELPNFCSAATVPFFTRGSAGVWEDHLFSIGFWNHMKESKGKTSFGQASIEGFVNDLGNPNLGRLSSFDYIDFVLKKSPYDKKRGDVQGEFVSIPEVTKHLEYSDKVFQAIMPDDYNTFLPPDALIGSRHNILGQNNIPQKTCIETTVNSVITSLGGLETILSNLTKSIYDERASNQDARIRLIFHNAIEDMKENGAKYLTTAREYDRKFQDLKKRWDKKKAEGGDDWKKEGGIRATLQKEYDDLKKSAEKDLAKFSFNQQMLDRLARLEEFNKVATPEQKKKFVQLLQCEWEPL